MRTQLLFPALAVSVTACFGAERCTLPEPIVTDLRACFTYENGLERNKPTTERFAVLKVREHTFLRQENPGPHYDPMIRPVFIYQGASRLIGINCPSGPTWVNCVAEWAQNPHKKDEGKVVYGKEPPPTYTAPTPKERPCEFTLEAPAWKPSPDNELKRRLAAEILQEIWAFAESSDTKAIYIRDFNVDDPEVSVYIVNATAEPMFLGCSFDASRSPHCQWHGFGQAPVAQLRRKIMSRPYRLYPPPIGAR